MSEQTDNHFIVPVKMLVALTVQADEDNLNDKVTKLVQKMQDSEELRTSFYEWSKILSDTIQDGSAILVPSLFLPVTDKKEADMAITFVKDLNKRIAEEQQNEQSTDN